MKRIKVKLGSGNSIDKAIKDLENIKKERLKQLDEFARRLAEEGRKEAQKLFDTADYDGTNDVVVSVERSERGYRVVAFGESVAFIEFGSGVTMPPYPADALVTHERGTYGKGQGANEKGWIYVGEQGTSGMPVTDRQGNVREGVYRTKGNPPAAAMYKAVRKMQEEAKRIAQEVFR